MRGLLVAAWASATLLASARAEIRHSPGRASVLYGAYLEHALALDPLALERAAALASDSSFLALEQALDADARGDHARMIELARKAVDLDPANGEAHALLALIPLRLVAAGLARVEDLPPAIVHGSEAVRLGAASPELFDRLASAHGVLATRARAARDGAGAAAHQREQRRVLEGWADRFHHDRAWQELAEFARDTDDTELEVKALVALLGRQERSILLLLRLAEARRHLGRCEDAIPLLEEAAASPELDPYSAISVQIHRGQCALEVGPVRVATSAFERALQLDPTNRLAAAGLAEALWIGGRREEAVAAIDALGAPGPEARPAERELDDATIRARWKLQRDLPDAVADARKVVSLAASGASRERAAASTLLSEALLSAGDVAGAEAAAREALVIEPTHEAGLLALASALWASSRKREAADEIAAAEKRSAPTASWLQRIARWEASRGMDEAARRHARLALESVTAAAGPSAGAMGVIGEVLLQAGDPVGAERELRAALGLRPGSADIAFVLADALAAQGRMADAVAILPPAAGADEYLLLRLAGWEAAHRLSDAAVVHARAARGRIPDTAHPAKLARFDSLVAAALLAADQPAEAMRWFDAALSRDALQPAERWAAAAASLDDLGRRDEGLARLDRGLERWPGNRSLVVQRAALLVKLGRAAEGVAAVEGVLAQPPTLPAEHARAALVLSEAGAPAEALRILERIRARWPEHAALWLASGRIRDQQGDVPGAESDLRRGVELDAGSASSLNALGYFLADHDRELEEAIRLLRRAVAQRPHEPAYLDSLGWALLRSGRLDEGAREIESAVARERDPVIVMHLATAREQQGRKVEALELYREALRVGLAEDLPRVQSRVKDLAASLEPRP